MKVTKIVILVSPHREDLVYLYTDLPDPTPPRLGKAVLKLSCPWNTAIDYCEQHFPDVPTEAVLR